MSITMVTARGAVTAARSLPWSQHSIDAVSAREVEVLQLVASGLGNRDIAAVLHVSEETVKTHVRRVLHKLGAHGRAHAVALAFRHGLID